MISFEEFQKVEMKVGKVVSAEDHPNADKLMVIRADIGEGETRTLVAALKPHYEPTELEGKLIVVVSNLQPVRLRGVESSGMLLAALDGDEVVVLTLDKPASPGSPVM